MAGGAGTERSVGGMATKVKAARRLAAQGVATALLSGRRPGALARAPRGRAGRDGLRARGGAAPGAQGLARRRRAGQGGHPRRRRAPARRSSRRGSSLLPSGVRTVQGSFGVGDPVDIAVDPGRPFARGLAGYGADEVRQIAGLKTSEIERALGYKYLDEIVHRDDLVVARAGPGVTRDGEGSEPGPRRRHAEARRGGARRVARASATPRRAAKDDALRAAADAIGRRAQRILAENARDVEAARKAGQSAAFLDRLALDEKRLEGIADGAPRGGGAARSGRRGDRELAAAERPRREEGAHPARRRPHGLRGAPERDDRGRRRCA